MHGAHGVMGVIVTDRGPQIQPNQDDDEEEEEKKYDIHNPIQSRSIDVENERRAESISVAGAVNQRPHLYSDILQHPLLNDLTMQCQIDDCYNTEIAIICQKCAKKLCEHCVNWEQHDIDKNGYYCIQCPVNVCEIDGCDQREFGLICDACNKKLCANHWKPTDDPINHCTECAETLKANANGLYIRARLICGIVTVANAIFNWCWIALILLIADFSNSYSIFVYVIFIVINSILFILTCTCTGNNDMNFALFVMASTMLTVILSFGVICTVLMLGSMFSNHILLIAFCSNYVCSIIYRIVLNVMYRKRFNKREQSLLLILYISTYVAMGMYLNIQMIKSSHVEWNEMDIFNILVFCVGIINILYDCILYCCLDQA